MGGANLLTKPMLLAFMDIFDALKVINTGTPTALDAPGVPPPRRTSPLSPCSTASVLDFWHHNRTALEEDADVLHTINRGGAYSDTGDPIVTQEVLGAVQRDPASGAILGAQALQLTLWLQVSPEANAWQQGAVPLVQGMQPPEPWGCTYTSTWHYNKTAMDETYSDMPLALCGFILILVYGVMLLFRPTLSPPGSPSLSPTSPPFSSLWPAPWGVLLRRAGVLHGRPGAAPAAAGAGHG